MSALKNRILKGTATVLLATVPVLGMGSGARAATSSTTQVGAASGQVLSVPTVNTTISPGISTPLSAPAESTAARGVVAKGIGGAIIRVVAKAFVAAVKKIPGAFSKLKAAVLGGYKEFVRFVQKLPTWVKETLKTVSLSSLYDWLKSHWNEWAK